MTTRTVYITTIHGLPIHKVTTDAGTVYQVVTPTVRIVDPDVGNVIRTLMTLHRWNVQTADAM